MRRYGPILGEMAGEYARIRLSATPKTRHYLEGQLAAPASVVFLDRAADGIFLYRYTSGGEFVGDTWHPNEDDARHQALFEFGDDLGAWKVVPADAVNLGPLAIEICADGSPG